MFHALLGYAQFNLEYLTMNKNCQVIQTHHSVLGLLF